MTTEEIKALFPIKAKVTRNIIKSSIIENSKNCIGANTLKSALLGKMLDDKVRWMWQSGFIDCVRITTVEGIDFMCIRKPTEVTFIVKEEEW